jgi:hypothetical protein
LAGPATADYLYSKEFTEAAQAVLARRYVDARTIAERMLESDPESFEAHAILGQVHLRGEQDLGLAQWHLLTARRLLEQKYTVPADEDAPRAVHQEILREQQRAAYLSERYQLSLDLVAEYEKLYEPHQDHLKGWPLLKLERYSEARDAVESARRALAEDDPRQVDLTDTLGQLAYEQGDLQLAEQQFQAAALMETDTAEQPDPVHLTNLGEVFRDTLRFAEAEETWLQACAWAHPGSFAQPFERLACLYANQGRWELSLRALEQSLTWRAELYPSVASHTRAWHLAAVGEVMLAMGESELALDVLERSLLEPNRQALSSGHSQVELAKRHLLYAGALELAAQKAAEARSWSSGQAWWRAGRQTVEARLAAAWARSRAGALLAQGGLSQATHPYGPGSMQCPWLLPQLSLALGPGATTLALAAPARDGEAAYRQLLRPVDSKPQKPAHSATSTADSLPQAETMAQAIVLARGKRWREALALDPSVTRRLGLSIGISVEGLPGLEEQLAKSPRFHPGKELTVKVSAERSCLVVDALGAELARVTSHQELESLSEALHQALFTLSTGWDRRRLQALTREASPGRLASARLQALLNDSQQPR